MNTDSTTITAENGHYLQKSRDQILAGWIELLGRVFTSGVASYEPPLTTTCTTFLDRFIQAYVNSSGLGLAGGQWEPVRELLVSFAKSRAQMGYTATQTAQFVLALRKPLTAALFDAGNGATGHCSGELERVLDTIEQLGTLTFEAYARSREELIRKQAQSILELSCPVIKIWDRVLLAVIIGTVDTMRSQQLMDGILKAVKDYEARIAIIDITGVAVMDTRVAQHLFTIVRAVRLLGAQVIMTGISPALAATVTKLQVDLSQLQPKSTLRAGLQEAFRLLGERSS